ncbi:MAG: hypothetical protein EAZ92_17955 [Candidatus Kapaibacterium sp.]|nr:MAG: hypothetical protein EAZ92_17955 [Candidatus Kapabacteria bacterium]
MKTTQGRKLIALLKKRGMSTLELQQAGLSTCPWKRISEQLVRNEELIKSKRYPDNGRWFYVYRVVTRKP